VIHAQARCPPTCGSPVRVAARRPGGPVAGCQCRGETPGAEAQCQEPPLLKCRYFNDLAWDAGVGSSVTSTFSWAARKCGRSTNGASPQPDEPCLLWLI